MKKTIICAAFALFAVNLFAADGGVGFSGSVESLWGVGAPWTDKDDSAGRFTLGTTSFDGKLDAYYGKSSAYVEATFSYDAVNRAGGNLTNGFNVSLDELWLDYTDSFWGIRIGRQKAAWGKADKIDIANVLCPPDMRSLAAMMDDKKLAVDAARFSLTGSQFAADAYWIPFFTPAALPFGDGNPLRKYLVPATVDVPVPAMSKIFKLPVAIGKFETPELALWNSEYGLRASGFFPAFDISLYAFYGWDDKPLMDYTITYGGTFYSPIPSGLTVSGKYERMAMVGADAAFPIGETVLRLEGAFFPARHFQKSSSKIMKEKMNGNAGCDLSEKRNQVSALAGIDWMPSGWTLTAQYYCDIVFGGLEALDRSDAYMHGATLSVSKTLLSETLELRFSGLIGFNDFDSAISPAVKYSVSDQITLGLKAFVFIPGPERSGKYGAYKNLSSICINAKFSF